MSGALRELLAVFGTEVDDSGLKKGEKGVESFKSTLENLGKTLLGAFAIDKVIDFTKEVLESADVLAKQSLALNVSAADLQGWQWAAKLSGSSAEEFTSAFTKFNRNVAEAGKGAGPAADAMKLVGVTAADLKDKLPIDLLDQVADGLIGIQDPAKRTEAVMALFGKSGNKLIPLFAEGASGIKKLRAETEQLGFSFDAAFLKDAQEVNDNLDRLKKGVMGVGIQAIKQVLPYLAEWTKSGVEIIKQLVDLVRHTEAVKASLLTFGLFGTAKAISGIVMLAQKAGFLKAGLRGLALELAPLVVGFLAIDDALTFLKGGDSYTGDLVKKLFGPDAPAKVQAFVKALKDDFGPTVREVFAILTQGKPLDERLKDLQNFVSSTLAPQFKTDFGDMANAMLKIVSAAGDVATAIEKIGAGLRELRDLVGWLADHAIINPIGKRLFAADDARLNDDARNRAFAGANPKRAPSAADFDLDQKPWFVRTLGKALGFKPEDAIPKDLRQQVNTHVENFRDVVASSAPVDPREPGVAMGAPHATAQAPVMALQSVATAPVMMSAPPAEISQANHTTINQYITASTPKEVSEAASDGAKSGVTKGIKGVDLLATQAAVAKRGG